MKLYCVHYEGDSAVKGFVKSKAEAPGMKRNLSEKHGVGVRSFIVTPVVVPTKRDGLPEFLTMISNVNWAPEPAAQGEMEGV